MILSCAAVSTLSGAGGMALWHKVHLGVTVLPLPYPDIVFRLGFATHQVVLVNLLIAAAMASLAWGISKSHRWAFCLEEVVCLAALANRVWTLWSVQSIFTNARHMPRDKEWHMVLYLIGTIPTMGLGWYSLQRSRRSGTDSTRAKSRAAATGELSVGLLMSTVCAIFFSCWAAAHSAEPANYWRRRYVLVKLTLLLIGYSAIVLAAVVPFLRKYARSLGAGFALLSPLALVMPGDEVALLPIILLFAPLAAMHLWLFLLSNLALLVTCIRGYDRNDRLAPMLLGAAYMFATLPATAAFEDYEQKQLARARENANGAPTVIYQIQSCLQRIKVSTGNMNYPRTLPEAERALPGCLPEGLASGGAVGGYRYLYQAANQAPADRFSLVADPTVRVGKVLYSFFSDETAVIRQQGENVLATANDSSLAPAADFDQLVGVVNNYTWWQERDAGRRFVEGALHFPETADDLLKVSGIQINGSHAAGQDTFESHGYRFMYRKTADDFENFELTARPIEYGANGIRSFLIDNTGMAHATVEDRPATRNDPDALYCDFQPGPCRNIRADHHFEPQRIGREEDAKATGIATDSTPRALWGIRDKSVPGFVGTSSDLTHIYGYVNQSGAGGLAAFKPDGTPLWGYAGYTPTSLSTTFSITSIDGEDALFALRGSVLVRLNSEGQELWSYLANYAHYFLRASNNMLYVVGGTQLHAIDKDGRLVWRVAIPERIDQGSLSSNEELLYVQNSHYLYAYETKSGRRLWQLANECEYAFCKPQPLTDGSVAMKWTVFKTKVAPGQPSAGLRIIDRKDKVVAERNQKDNLFDYFVPVGTNIVVIEDEHDLEAIDAQAKLLWMKEQSWQSTWYLAGISRKTGRFYTCHSGIMTVMDVLGNVKFEMPREIRTDASCRVYEGPGDLVIVPQYKDSNGARTLWTLRIGN